VGIFQYESAGMQKYMKELKPTVFRFNCECVIPPRTNCLYPEFCKRKNGKRRLFMTLRPVKRKIPMGLPFIKNRCFYPKKLDFSRVMPMFYVKRWKSKRCP
jgi:hypothetical protein